MSKLVLFSALILAMANLKTLPYILYNFVISKEMRKIQQTKIPLQENHMVFMQLRQINVIFIALHSLLFVNNVLVYFYFSKCQTFVKII